MKTLKINTKTYLKKKKRQCKFKGTFNNQDVKPHQLRNGVTSS